MNQSEQLIELIAWQTKSLLDEHWSEIESYRDGNAEIKVNFTHALSYEGDLKAVKTVISFSHRIRAQIEDSINTAQSDLPLKVTIEKGKHK